MYPVDGKFILAVAPKFTGAKAEAQRAIVADISPVFATTLDHYGINTRLRIAHFMGQVTHECAGFRTTEEFASGDAYEGRLDLGNVKKDDGRRYKGRGLLQLTGRDNYRRIGKILGVDLEEDPLKAGEPVLSLKIACEYWKGRKINDPSDEDDLVEVTRRVQGGNNGLEDRGFYLKRAKVALADMDAIVIGTEQKAVTPVLRRGSFDAAVGKLQALLRAKGYQLAIDDEFGGATELAVIHFQEAAKLTVDGIVGAETWAALRK